MLHSVSAASPTYFTVRMSKSTNYWITTALQCGTTTLIDGMPA
jgi:hypothetical protein